MSNIHEFADPNVGNAGLAFDYNVWSPGTSITMLNVNWSGDYRDVVRFSSKAAFNSWIDSQSAYSWSVTSMTYARLNTPVRISMPFATANAYNYLRVRNPSMPVQQSNSGTDFYYFISEVRYIAPNTTELILQLDVWQTYGYDVQFGQCYVTRGHIGIANENAFDDRGRTYLTIPEGLDIGNEYVINEVDEYELARLQLEAGVPDGGCGIIITSTANLANVVMDSWAAKPDMDMAEFGTVADPNLNTAHGSTTEFLPNGCEIYYFDGTDNYLHFLKFIADKPWISQCIASVTVVPPILDKVTFPWGSSAPYIQHGTTIPEMFRMHDLSWGRLEANTIPLLLDWRDTALTGRYSRLKKFLTYPYTVIELTTYSGNPLILKPECLPTDHLWLDIYYHVVPPNPRVTIIPKDYNAKAANQPITASEFLDFSTGIFDLPTFSVTNNAAMGYIAANQNRIQYQYSSANWSQQKALTSANVNSQIATTNMDRDSQNALEGQQRRTNLANNQQENATARGLAGAIGSMNPVAMGIGAIGGYVNQHLSADMATANATTNNLRDFAQSRETYKAAGQVRDLNKGMANYAAAGDYANEIAGIQARVQDAALIQPTTSGQIGGDAFNLAAFGKWVVNAKVKMLQKAPMAAIGEYWLRYGYAVERFTTPPANLKCMSKFTYWQMRETYLNGGNVPESFKQTIRGIFEKGVTVWSNPADIGNIDMATNVPLGGITL